MIFVQNVNSNKPLRMNSNKPLRMNSNKPLRMNVSSNSWSGENFEKRLMGAFYSNIEAS
jgi:hypothetical protein